MEHEAEGPDVDFGGGFCVAYEQFGGHESETAAVYFFHTDPGNGPKNAKINNFEVHGIYDQPPLGIVLRLLSYHDVLEFEVPVNNLAVVAVVDGVHELDEQSEGFSL